MVCLMFSLFNVLFNGLFNVCEIATIRAVLRASFLFLTIFKYRSLTKNLARIFESVLNIFGWR